MLEVILHVGCERLKNRQRFAEEVESLREVFDDELPAIANGLIALHAVLNAYTGETRYCPGQALINTLGAFLRNMDLTDRIAGTRGRDRGPQHQAIVVQREPFDVVEFGFLRVPYAGAPGDPDVPVKNASDRNRTVRAGRLQAHDLQIHNKAATEK